MKFKEIKNLDVIRIIENATELFRNKKYQSKKFVEKFIGLNLSRAGFYGQLQTDNTVNSLEYDKVIFNSSVDVTLLIEGIVILKNVPVNNGSGNITYSGYGLLEVNDVIIYDGRVESSSVGTSPTNTIKGRATAGTGPVEDLTPTQVRNLLNVEDGADATDATNVTAAGALMDSEVTDLAGVKGVTISTLQVKPTEGAFADGDKTKLDGIESSATADQTDSEIETAYNAQVAIATQAEAEAGTLTDVKRFTPQRIKQAIDANGGTPALNNGQIFVGNASNAATSVAMSGDTTIDNAGAVTIGNDKVTYPKMQDTTQAAILGTALGAGTVSEIPIVEQYLSAGTTATLLENTSNWDVNGVYTGTSITGTYQGQAHHNGNYWFTAIDDNVWIRLIRG